MGLMILPAGIDGCSAKPDHANREYSLQVPQEKRGSMMLVSERKSCLSRRPALLRMFFWENDGIVGVDIVGGVVLFIAKAGFHQKGVVVAGAVGELQPDGITTAGDEWKAVKTERVAVSKLAIEAARLFSQWVFINAFSIVRPA
jgi:hypothetical protein